MKNCTVLIVEDEMHIAEVVAMKLRQAGLAVLIAPETREAMVLLGRESIDLVIADVALPGMSGVDLAFVMAGDARLSRVPILLITGMSAGVAPGRICGTNVVGVIPKPFSPRLLLEKTLAAIAEGHAARSVTKGKHSAAA